MLRRHLSWVVLALALSAEAQNPPYDVFPVAKPPFYRVRYEPSGRTNELIFGVNFTVWVPPGVKALKGVVVHQHGCGEGSCKSGLTGAYDLHWQALARRHDCALLSPSYEQPEKADCQRWCDPRHGSDQAFLRALKDLGGLSGHPELATVPWALWGHSGGGHWAGGMVMLHPDRVVGAWLRSGVPLLEADAGRSDIRHHPLPDAALAVPIMCNLGTKEGFSVKDDRFSGVWPANLKFFKAMRSRGATIGVSVDTRSSHDCGDQRYLAIRWLDACLKARLPARSSAPLRPIPNRSVWLSPLPAPGTTPVSPVPAKNFDGPRETSVWLPSREVAHAWHQYSHDGAVSDSTRPPAPHSVRVEGNRVIWEAEADLESGLARFILERDGQRLAEPVGSAKNPYGRPVFQGLQYSDTPPQPLAPMEFVDTTATSGQVHRYRVIAVNTAGLESR